MENGRLIHKFFPIGSFLSENQTILGDLYRHTTTFDVCVLYTFRDFKMICEPLLEK